MRARTIVMGVVVGVLGIGGIANCSMLAPCPPDAHVRLLAHRGVHQQFSRAGLTRDSCTAAQALPADHTLLENTLPSMAAAFEHGATVVELDIHPTLDDQLAVFHDWTLDCRTDGTGEIRHQPMAALQALDLGHGYTSNGGTTHPLRGTAVGQMPTLPEVLAAFPEGRFLVNVKSKDLREVDLLKSILDEHPRWRDQVWSVYGSPPPIDHAAGLWPDMPVFSSASVKGCIKQYMLWGWSGVVPKPCQNTVVVVPINVGPLLWGWPHRFGARMAAVGTTVILTGPYTRGDTGTTGIDSLELLAQVPDGFDGFLWTNRIELIGPALHTP